MNEIKILDASLADKIAAGEVVEGPFSVIKELVENSIDAKASIIDIFVESGGKTSIEVKDNGKGMSKDDACLSIKRHATSKISNDFDLFNIKTMGFRGEALSAISAVSKFTLTTKNKDSIGATRLFCLNSEVISIENATLDIGTDIKVEELFYNTPARLKYLKSESSEFNKVLAVLNNLALAHPEIAFSLFSDGKLSFKTSGRNDLIETISAIYGLNIAKNMNYFESENNDFKIFGYTSNISISKANKYSIHTFMNQRLIRNKFLTDSIIEGYHEFLFDNRYPYTILFIKTDPTLLDVNVHPTKQEIRISKENELKEFIKNIIANTLKGNSQIINQEIKGKEKAPVQGFFDYQNEIINDDSKDYVSEPIKFEENIESNNYEIIGQIHGTYIIAQNNDGFILVDQHAAKERINYEKFKKIFYEPSSTIDLLIPKVIDLSNDDFHKILENKELLNKVHINFETFGNNTIKISSIPYYFKRIDLDVYLDELLNQVVTNAKINEAYLLDYAIATAACKASIKANTYLTIENMQSIINDLFKCDDPYTCPHGRPTMVKYSKDELKKFFKRT